MITTTTLTAGININNIIPEQALSAQTDDIATLTRAGSVTALLNEDPPAGASVNIVNDQCQVNSSGISLPTTTVATAITRCTLT